MAKDKHDKYSPTHASEPYGAPSEEIPTTPEITFTRVWADNSWIKIEFDGLTPQDGLSSLFRKWSGTVIATRSDNVHIELPLKLIQRDGPAEISRMVENLFHDLETYRNCNCTNEEKCVDHSPTGENA